jgi:hypothetical protein
MQLDEFIAKAKRIHEKFSFFETPLQERPEVYEPTADVETRLRNVERPAPRSRSSGISSFRLPYNP